MCLYIGKQQQSGEIKYISVNWQPGYNMVSPMLKNFYPNEKRVDALIDLGNLMLVNGSPYGKFNMGSDLVHCRAEIRDDKEKKGKHLPRYSSEAEFLKLEGYLFLYKEGKWHYRYADGFSASLPETLPFISNKPLEGLEFYYLDEEGKISYIYGRDFKNWNDIVAKSEKDETPVFVFRNNKLVTTINHPLNR
jgi:hypothetical protein